MSVYWEKFVIKNENEPTYSDYINQNSNHCNYNYGYLN